jgi:hypothetical protein
MTSDRLAQALSEIQEMLKASPEKGIPGHPQITITPEYFSLTDEDYTSHAPARRGRAGELK